MKSFSRVLRAGGASLAPRREHEFFSKQSMADNASRCIAAAAAMANQVL